jgi:hypothetical protein
MFDHELRDLLVTVRGSAVPVRALGAGEVAGEVAERDDALRPRLEVADLDLAVRQLVAQDDGEVRPVPAGGLELAAELPAREVGPCTEPGGAQDGGDAQPAYGVIRVRAHDHGQR